MISLLDNMVATHTDYATLRRQIPESDTLVFARDALLKISQNISRIALNISRNKKIVRRSSVKAELRAFEYELELYRKHGLDAEQPETYALLVQVLRRLRNAATTRQRMAGHIARPPKAKPVTPLLRNNLGLFRPARWLG